MTLTTVAGRPAGENSDDLRGWLGALPGAPAVTGTAVLTCGRHGDDEPGWFYVEADARNGVARRRCVACGTSSSLLDSDARWTHPPMVACRHCEQSLLEVAAGWQLTDGRVGWVALGGRCVTCGTLQGLTDVVIPAPGLSPEELTARM